MDLTRRKAALAFGAAVLGPLLAPGEAAACLFHHRRRGVPCPPSRGRAALRIDGVLRPTTCLDDSSEVVGSPITCAQTSPFVLGTRCRFTLVPAPGSSFNQNGMVNIVSIFEANTQCVFWDGTTLVSSPSVHNQLVFDSTPKRTANNCASPVGSSGLSITVQSVYDPTCRVSYWYRPVGGVSYRV